MPCPYQHTVITLHPLFDDLESPFCFIYYRNPLEGRPSNLQNCCRYDRDQPIQLAVQELRKLWKFHAKLLEETEEQMQQKTRKSPKPVTKLIFYHRVSGILNDSTVMLTTADWKEKKCNIHHVKPIMPVDAATNAFDQFQDSIKKNPYDTAQNQYNLRSKVKFT